MWDISGVDGHNENNNVNRNSVIIQPKLYHRSHKVNRPGCLTYRWWFLPNGSRAKLGRTPSELWRNPSQRRPSFGRQWRATSAPENSCSRHKQLNSCVYLIDNKRCPPKKKGKWRETRGQCQCIGVLRCLGSRRRLRETQEYRWCYFLNTSKMLNQKQTNKQLRLLMFKPSFVWALRLDYLLKENVGNLSYAISQKSLYSNILCHEQRKLS